MPATAAAAKRGVVDPPVRPGGHAQHDLPDAGHPGRHRAHQHRRRIPGPAARCVTAGAGHRAHQMPNLDPPRLEVAHLGIGRLVGVVGQDPVVGDVESLLQRHGDAGQGSLDLRRLHPELVQVDPVELPGQAAQGRVTVGPHLGDHGRHGLRGTVLLVGGTRQGVPQGPAVSGEASEVQLTESHSPSMLPDRPASALRATWAPGRLSAAGDVTVGAGGAMIGRWPPAPQNSPRSPPHWTN